MSVRALRLVVVMSPLVLAAFTVAAAAAGRAAATPRAQYVTGQAQFQLAPGPTCTSPLGICTSGTISGDLRGTVASTAYTFVVPADASVPPVGSYVNRIVIRTADGEVTCTEAGAANTTGDGEFAGLCQITGAGGRLAGAHGYLLFRGVCSPSTMGVMRRIGWSTGSNCSGITSSSITRWSSVRPRISRLPHLLSNG